MHSKPEISAQPAGKWEIRRSEPANDGIVVGGATTDAWIVIGTPSFTSGVVFWQLPISAAVKAIIATTGKAPGRR